MVSISRNIKSDCISQDLLFRNTSLWAPDVPPPNLAFTDKPGTPKGSRPLRFVRPFSTAFLEDPSTLTQVIAWTYDVCTLTGITFKYADSSKDLLFGHNGPYDSMPRRRMYDPPQDGNYVAAIDGRGGERITAIHVQASGITIRGLKVSTPQEIRQIIILTLLILRFGRYKQTGKLKNCSVSLPSIVMTWCGRPSSLPRAASLGFTPIV